MIKTKEIKEGELVNNNSISKELIVLTSLFIMSMFSVFGIFNTFSDYNLVKILLGIESQRERYGNIAIAIIFVVYMGMLQGINFKKKDLFGKFTTIGISLIFVSLLGAIVFYFTSSLIYPIATLLIIGVSMYLFEMVFVTIGLKGLFFLLTIFLFILVGLFKNQHYSINSLLTIGEALLGVILFVGATFPRLKSLIFKIQTRDNVDISNTGSGDHDEDEDDY